MTSQKNYIKNKVFQILNEYLKTNEKLTFSWFCEFCGKTHYGNLLKKANSVKLKYSLKGLRPDLYFIDNKNNLFAVIKLIYNNKSSKKAIQFCKENNIILIECFVKLDDDREQLIEKIKRPDNVHFCLNPKCKKCNNFLQTKILQIVDGECYKCSKQMKLAALISSNHGYVRNGSNLIGPSEFTNYEIQIAKEKGVLLQTHYSKTIQERYLANTCPNCKSFAGEHYLFTDYFCPGVDYKKSNYEIGYVCDNCEKNNIQEYFLTIDDIL